MRSLSAREVKVAMLAILLLGGSAWWATAKHISSRISSGAVRRQLTTPEAPARNNDTRSAAPLSAPNERESAARPNVTTASFRRQKDDPGPGREYMALYQGRSGRLSPNARIDGGEHATVIRSPGAAPSLSVWVDNSRALADRDVIIHAELRGNGGEPLVPDTLVARIRAERTGEEIAVSLVKSSAGELTAVFRPKSESLGESGKGPAPFHYVVLARGEADGERYERSAAGLFSVHRPGATFDERRFTAEIRDGDLVVTVPATAVRPGDYWGYAELWSEGKTGAPLVFARDKWTLREGAHQTVELRFGGRVLRDLGVDGPYVVRNVRLLDTAAIPAEESEPIREALTTPAWTAAGFH